MDDTISALVVFGLFLVAIGMIAYFGGNFAP